MHPPGVILAGGRATRMGGGDKALLRLGGVALIDRVNARLAPQVAALAINANGDPARFARTGLHGLPVLPDSVPDHPGPLAGVLAARDWAAGQGAAQVVTVAGDTPFLPRDLVARLVAQAGAGPVLAATPRAAGNTRSSAGDLDRQPVCGLWPVALRADLRAALAAGQRKAALWADAHGARAAVFPLADGPDPFFNVNTPDDLRAAEALL